MKSSHIQFLVVMVACLLGLCSIIQGYPMGLVQNPRLGKMVQEDANQMDDVVKQRQMSLRFCRYCLSQPLICGDLHDLCYAMFKQY